MTTSEELTSWRVAAVEGRLPDPARSDRWQPQRAGVVNLWEYDAAEVWYADGRMQLQGANESGKSTLMTLTTLLLLAGEISSHNIDTLGQGDKHFRYYVEPTDHALDRRDTSARKNRGWAWLEFGKGTEFFTLLLFAEARRADAKLTVNWCTLSGHVRVRSGLSLTTAGLVTDPAQFRDVPGFVMHPSGTAYREAIGRTLYGTDEAWLNQLNRILRVVRTPQIGHKIDLKFLTSAFRTALPPIAEDEINQLADGWEQLQRLRDERDEADRALAAVTEFSRRAWRPWADAVIRAATDPVTAAASALTQITREEGLKGGGGEQARLVQPFQLGMRSVACATMIGVWPSLSSRRTRTLSGPATGGSCAGTSQRLTCRDDVLSIALLDIQLDRVTDITIWEDLMSRTVVDLDDEALSLASEELGTKSKVATVNAALRRVANQRAAAHMLELLDETGADLSDEALRGAWRDGGRG